jgi:hypothetical protein
MDDSQLQTIAAWVQAVGSILAICAAAGFVWWQHRLEGARDGARRADKIRGLLDVLQSEIRYCSDVASEFLGRHHPAILHRLPKVAFDTVLPALMAEGILKGDSLAAVYGFYSEVTTFNDTQDAIARLWGENPEEWAEPNWPPKLQENFEVARIVALRLMSGTHPHRYLWSLQRQGYSDSKLEDVLEALERVRPAPVADAR